MNQSVDKRDLLLAVAAVFATVFGLMTIVSGGKVLFGPDEAQRAAGAYVGFVVWFNFIAGFVYVAAGAGLLMRRRWGAVLSFTLLVATVLVFVAFGLHVSGGGAYEMRTVGALVFRTAVWLAIAWVARRKVWSTDAPRALQG